MEIDRWMKRGWTWREMQENRPLEGSRRLPGLRAPEGIFALLVMSYPDMKFRDRIRQLQLDRMTMPALHVTDGFWRGLTATDRDRLFLPEDVHTAEVELLLPYDTLLGAAFVACQRDMRPHLPAWASDITLEGEPNLNGLPIPDKGAGEREPDDPPFAPTDQADPDLPRLLPRLRELLVWTGARTGVGDDLAEDWLIAKAIDGTEMYAQWCSLWVEKCSVSTATRSSGSPGLFSCRACIAYKASMPQPNSRTSPRAICPSRLGVSQTHDITRQPVYRAWTDRQARFVSLVHPTVEVDSEASASLARIEAQQTGFIDRVLRDPSTASYVTNVFTLDRIRTQMLVQEMEARPVA